MLNLQLIHLQAELLILLQLASDQLCESFIEIIKAHLFLAGRSHGNAVFVQHTDESSESGLFLSNLLISVPELLTEIFDHVLDFAVKLIESHDLKCLSKFLVILKVLLLRIESQVCEVLQGIKEFLLSHDLIITMSLVLIQSHDILVFGVDGSGSKIQHIFDFLVKVVNVHFFIEDHVLFSLLSGLESSFGALIDWVRHEVLVQDKF